MRKLALVLTLLACCILPASAAEPKKGKRTEVDEAVDRALLFLQRMQETDGSWTAGRSRKSPAITGLAVMSYLSAGHVPGEGPYGETVEKGIRWVLKQQQNNGLIASLGGHEMYEHGICTQMLAEAVGMTDGKLTEEVRKALEKAVAIVLKAQRTTGNDKGGWRYRVLPVDGSDISVTGWQVMALRAAKNLGCDVPPEAIDRAVEYIKRCQDPSTGGFRYTPYGGVTVPCTGTSILALEICGKDRHHSPEALKGGNHLIKNPPKWGSPHFFYSTYYCTQATFQLGDTYWNFFRPHLHDQLLKNQNKDNGGWIGGDYDAQAYGPCYSTAMGVLALTVEYRFLPIYQRGEEPTDKRK
jgi:hypothetical protein